MIANRVEYEAAQREIRELMTWIEGLQRDYPLGELGYSKAGVRKMIARVQEELAEFEARSEVRKPSPAATGD